MSLAVSKACFPDSSKCDNCERKMTNKYKVFTTTEPKENFKRCSSCHLMTYCGKDCQREHWLKVHKKHCKFLSGKTEVKDSNHDSVTCAQCIQEREMTRTQLVSADSPKTRCNIEFVNGSMKNFLSSAFQFHGEGKKCNCSLKHGLQLPFPLGEVSGQYLEIAGTGLDPMLAHALKILYAMFIKAVDEEQRNALDKVLRYILTVRGELWWDILICGMPRIPASASGNNMFDQVNSLLPVFGTSNPWWKILRFSVAIVDETIGFYAYKNRDSRDLNDPRFAKVKLMRDYKMSQLQNQAIVWEKKMWLNYMLWPQLVNGSLVVLLPPGTRCQSCSAQLFGEVALSSQEKKPILLPKVCDNGALGACCSTPLKPSCLNDCLSKNVEYQMRSNETEWKAYLKESDLFGNLTRVCDFCLKSSLTSHRCSGCLTVQYCSLACQKEDKDFHNTRSAPPGPRTSPGRSSTGKNRSKTGRTGRKKSPERNKECF